MARALPLFAAMQVKIDRINQVTREALSGVRVIRAFVRTQHEEERFDVANHDLTATSLRVNRMFALMIPPLMGIFNLSSVAILWFGAFRVDSGEMPIGNLIAFLQYVMQILFAVMMAVFMFVHDPAGRSSRPAGSTRSSGPRPRSASRRRRSRHRRRPGRSSSATSSSAIPGAQDPVLRDISLVVEPGQTTAIVGSTGSGKSTLINLIPRFYDVTGGSLTIDGVDVREVRQDDVWARIGLVPQKAFLFNGTIASNLRFGKTDATDDELWDALRIAQADTFVREMEEGLEAPVTQGGSNLSGGQRQRSRSPGRSSSGPRSTSSTTASRRSTSRPTRGSGRPSTSEIAGATVVIVAQRVGTIMGADRIVVLDGGAIVGQGTHQELMATCETYREIVYSQLSTEEAA